MEGEFGEFAVEEFGCFVAALLSAFAALAEFLSPFVKPAVAIAVADAGLGAILPSFVFDLNKNWQAICGKEESI